MSSNQVAKKQNRNSSIELLKVVGIVLIVISHVIQTLHSPNDLVGTQDYVLSIANATDNVQYLLLAMLRYSGALGNTIFFVCSSWFLLDSDKASLKKELQMLLDIWVVSLVIFVIVYILRNGNIDAKTVIKQFLPTTFENNWYMTCYLLFYPIHPFLNWIIKKMKQVELLRTVLVLSFLYIGVNFIQGGHFFTSALILWITIYFIIGYMKYYLREITRKRKINVVLFAIGFIGHYGLIWLTNYLGLHIGAFENKLFYWNTNCNPFSLIMAISMLNIAGNIYFTNRIINYVSKLSLLIYIIHENILLRSYYRPLMWQWIYTNVGYQSILLWTFVLVLIVFAFGLIASIIYKNTIQKVVTRAVESIYPAICKIYRLLETKIIHLQ